ncbi:Verru_Chthon cassette protein C [Prosthecobacter sp.]|uniref:Verru_Chthon cassette protein C n=1 Tax=Prosthecobacter sp. TaxID=1965333 RepID=UPI002AB97E27|nr:Verru_Chthon cassette protein C [Prosthecobacter sp.]MDZ4403380.1 Verru_Chthon cassette protein C [Prosthecobacter sp.]
MTASFRYARTPLLRRTFVCGAKGFTLIELLVSMTFLVILMLVVTQVIGIVQRTWVRTNSRVSQFREARMAFDVISRTLSQATLNTYWENEFDPLGTDIAGEKKFKAKNYVRQSELQFVCGPTTGLLPLAAANSQNYPGHGVFFQAPLGVTKLVVAGTGDVNTENMVNLMCGRGYFVEWGSDEPFRPPFLSTLTSVPLRFRMRLMEYSPTAEMNRIYDSSLRPLVDNETGTNNGKKWFQEGETGALTSIVKDNETTASRAFTRPVAENILALIISPQQEVTGNAGNPYDIAPNYIWDSTLTINPGASASSANPQGTQHLLPPLLKVTMIALDQMGGETLSREENEELREKVLGKVGGMFQKASDFAKELEGTEDSQGELEELLLSNKLNYRVFTTTIALKQSRWSL